MTNAGPYERSSAPRNRDGSYLSRSHIDVDKTPATFWNDPVDILRGILDIAGLAMNAVLSVDLQSRVRPIDITHDLIHARRTIIVFRRTEAYEIDGRPDRPVAHHKMARLIFFVVRIGDKYRREFVDCNLAVGLGIWEPRALIDRL